MNPGYLACGGWIANAVAAAARLGIADLLEDRPRSAAELAAHTGTQEAIVERLMNLLVTVKLFAETDDARYANTDDSRLLCDRHPQSIRHFCILAGDVYQRGFGELMHTLHSGKPGLERAYGMSLLELMREQPETGAIYDKAMEDLSRPVGAALAASRDFTGVRLIVDIGGGRGALLRGLLRQLPAAPDGLVNGLTKGLVLDRAGVCERATAALPGEAPDLVGRLSFESGDFFSAVPPGADLYLLKNVLHNWSDEHCRQLLGKVRDVLQGRPAARLLIIEPVLDGEMPALYKALDSLMQTVVSEAGSRGRSAEELRALATTAGLTVTGSHSLKSGQLVIEAKASP
jgi:hypothetical protein